jgi:hypothetical protein
MQNTIEIEGQIWHSKKSLMAQLGIKKSLFYERVNDGIIASKKVFDDSYFRVYKINEPADD